ncbi:MAG: carboxymuconolactone decarboxylase family protein [Actinomycetota bacterium]|nr:carboxymuconolactone decarboxylase family protein [Actinomycetota bacterium]
MSRLPLRRPEELDAAQRAVYDAIVGGTRGATPRDGALTNEDGSLIGPFNAMVTSPTVGGPLQAVGEALRYRSSLSDAVRELAILVTAAHWDAPFEWWAHVRIAERAGIDPAMITAIERGEVPDVADEELRLVHEVATMLLDSGTLGDETYAAVEARFGPDGVVELLTLIGYYSTIAFILNAVAVEAPTD